MLNSSAFVRDTWTSWLCVKNPRDGTGRRTEPLRYWLAAKEPVWREDPLYQLEEQMRKGQEEAMRVMGAPWRG